MRIYHRLGYFSGVSLGGWGLVLFLFIVVPFLVTFLALYTLGWILLGLFVLIHQTAIYVQHHGPTDPSWSSRMRPFFILFRERF